MKRISSYLFSLVPPLHKTDLKALAWAGELSQTQSERFSKAPQLYIGEALWVEETKTIAASPIIKHIKDLLGDAAQRLTEQKVEELITIFEGHNLTPMPINTDLLYIRKWLKTECGRYIYIVAIPNE